MVLIPAISTWRCPRSHVVSGLTQFPAQPWPLSNLSGSCLQAFCQKSHLTEDFSGTGGKCWTSARRPVNEVDVFPEARGPFSTQGTVPMIGLFSGFPNRRDPCSIWVSPEFAEWCGQGVTSYSRAATRMLMPSLFHCWQITLLALVSEM